MSTHRLLASAVAALAALGVAVSVPPAPDDARPGEWVWPLAGGSAAVVRGFDPPALPWEAGHRGVDLLGAEDEPVRAAGAGTVTYAGQVAGVGVVTVTHGELRTTYQPVRSAVSIGDRVGAGDQIGTLVLAGGHCPPSACLHWGLLRGDAYLNPLDLVRVAGRPRLLPLGERALEPVRQGAVQPAAGAPDSGPITHRAAIGALAGLG